MKILLNLFKKAYIEFYFGYFLFLSTFPKAIIVWSISHSDSYPFYWNKCLFNSNSLFNLSSLFLISVAKLSCPLSKVMRSRETCISEILSASSFSFYSLPLLNGFNFSSFINWDRACSITLSMFYPSVTSLSATSLDLI